MSLEAVIKVAEGEVGVTELPAGSNKVKYWDIFGPSWQGQPWCLAFLAWVFREAGESAAFFGGALTASCGILLRWYQAQGQTVPIQIVQPGDILILDFSGQKTDTQHCGLVIEVGWISHGVVGWIKTIEGNTTNGSGSQSNGGMVCAKTRYPSQIVGVCRPRYKAEEVKPVDDLTGHWAEAEIRRCIKRGLIKGYPDGTFLPDKTVTRAEVAVMMDRLVQILVGEDKV